MYNNFLGLSMPQISNLWQKLKMAKVSSKTRMAIKRPASPVSSARAAPVAMTPLCLPSLPLSLFSLVLEFAIFEFSQDLGPQRRELPSDPLTDVALVAKSWCQAVEELVARIRRDTMQLTLKFGSRVEVLALRRKVQLRGRAVRDLRVRMGRSDGSRFHAGVWWWMEDRKVPWGVIFSQMPGLKRLDLRLMPLESRHLPILLQNAAKYCLQLEMLVLPKKQDAALMVNCVAVNRVMEVLKEALQRWHMKGKCGGLKQLTVPTREEENRFQTSTAFIEHVVEFCPNVEYLDGYNLAVDDMNDVTCAEKWMISLETWEKFNQTCTNLRDFHWVVVPFADPFFRVFGEHVKPKLKKLALTSNVSWDWADYFKRDGETGLPTEKPGYGVLANDVTALLKGCPALRELEIAIDQERNEVPLVSLLDADVFGDKFWEAVVDQCPLLQSVYLHDCSGYGGSRIVRPVRTFTDRALLALAKHTQLTSIELSSVCCSGDGVFDFLRHVFKADNFAGGNRSLVLNLAGPIAHDPVLPHPFYQELVKLLRHLAETSEEELGVASCSHKPSLNVFNPHSSCVDKEWSIAYMRDELKPILDEVASAHPTLDMQVVLCRDPEDRFQRIDNLELDWRPGSQQGDIYLEDDFVGDPNNGGGSDEDDEFFDEDEEDGFIDPRERFLRHRPMFLEDDVDPADIPLVHDE
jgi:hypothetical protein